MESERPIEKLLRAAAEKRRAEAGERLSLHPANRRILQAEAVRVHTPKGRPQKSFLSALSTLWPQLAWSFALVVALGLAAFMMVSRGPQPQLSFAQNNFRPAAPTRSLAAEPQPADSQMFFRNPSQTVSAPGPSPAREAP